MPGGRLVTFGITPTGPETGYGYIEAGAERGDGTRDVARFVEKPDAAKAAEMLAQGSFVAEISSIAPVPRFEMSWLAKASATTLHPLSRPDEHCFQRGGRCSEQRANFGGIAH